MTEKPEELAASQLWGAVAANDEQAVTSLLENGANPDHELYFTKNWTSSLQDNEPHPLLVACRNGNLAIIKLLVEQGKVGISRKLSPDTGDTILHASCGRYGNLDITKYLVEEIKCDADVTNTEGERPLDVAVSYNRTEIAAYLRSISQPTKSGTPLSEEDSDALQRLLQNANVKLSSSQLTFEKVQKQLTERGCDELAKNLRQELNKVIKEQQENVMRLKELMKDKDTLSIHLLKTFLVGPPGVGKTTTLNRLLKVITNIDSAGDNTRITSTLLANCLQVFAFVSGDGTEWISSHDPNQETVLLFRYLCGSKLETMPVKRSCETQSGQDFNFKPKHSEHKYMISTDATNKVPVHHTTNQHIPSRVYNFITRLQKLIMNEGNLTLLNYVGGTLLNISDIGGQPGFLEMLPALISGPAMYLVFFDLSKQLDKPYKIPFNREDTVITPYDAMHTVETTISQILSAIASVHCCTHETSQLSFMKGIDFEEKFKSFQNVQPKAALVGTHKDQLTEDTEGKLESINDSLIKLTSTFDKIVAYPSSKCFFAVDNLTGKDQDDVGPIRNFMSYLFQSHFKNASLPIRPKWLWLSLILRREFKIVSTVDCQEIGSLLEMDREEINTALWYLHYCTGSLMYYPDISDEWFKNNIICSPQVVFDSISELVVSSLRSLHAGGPFTEYERSEMIQMGQFSLDSIAKYCSSYHVNQGDLIPPKQLIKLLNHVNLLSPIVHTETDGSQRVTYLLPAILENVSPDELSTSLSPDSSHPESLFIMFSCGYVPTGTFCGLITRLVSLGSNGIFGLSWELVERGVKRNCVSFFIDGSNMVTLISHERCYEVRVALCLHLLTLHDLCSYVLSVIFYILKSLYKNLVPLIAFNCPCPKHESSRNVNNLCILVKKAIGISFRCERKLNPVILREYQRMWLGKAVSLGSSVELEVLKFADDDDFSFLWTKEDSKCQIETTSEPNILMFSSVNKEDLGYYRCEVKKAGKLILSVHRALYKDDSNFVEPESDVLEHDESVPSAFQFLKQPEDTSMTPGYEVNFTVLTDPQAEKYQWYFQGIEDDEYSKIAHENMDYTGSTTNKLIIKKCFSKHRGRYKCMSSMIKSGIEITSSSASLAIAGKEIKGEEAYILGQILQNSEIDYGVSTEQLRRDTSDLTYEEMNLLLYEKLKVHINLEEELKSRVEEEHYYEKAVKEDGTVSLRYFKLLTLGPGQVGKSTFLYRLLGLMEWDIATAPPHQRPKSSTGQMDLREAWIEYTGTAYLLDGDSKEWHIFKELHDQVDVLTSLICCSDVHFRKSKEKMEEIVHDHNDSIATPSHSSSSDSSSQLPSQQGMTSFVKENTFTPSACEKQSGYLYETVSELELFEITKTINEFEDFRQPKLIREKLKTDTMFNIADVGGQPAFLEILASLTIGPALYLVFMKLLDGLGEECPVTFRSAYEKSAHTSKEYTYTPDEIIFTALSGIALFGKPDLEVEKYISTDSTSSRASSLALLLGTFEDKYQSLDDTGRFKIDKMEHQLKCQIEETAFYIDDLVEFSDRETNKLFFRINNENGGKEEVDRYKKRLEALMETRFKKYEIPVPWLMFSICLKLHARNKGTSFVSFPACVKIGEHFGIKPESMVKISLRFLHKYIGLVMYFPENEKLSSIVICDPQIVFSSVSELIFKVYDPKNTLIPIEKYYRFVKTGRFSLEDVKEKRPDLLPMDWLVNLLVQLNIAAKVESSNTKEYILPAVLRTKKASELDNVRISNLPPSEHLSPEPICILFKTGYVPLGFVCALLANLIARQEFRLYSKEIYKNKVTFCFKEMYEVIVISCPRYCKIFASHIPNASIEEHVSSKLIREKLCEAVNCVVQNMQHGSVYKQLNRYYDLAFKCPNSEKHSLSSKFGSEQLAAVIHEGHKRFLRCSYCGIRMPLKAEMEVWYIEPLKNYVIEQPRIRMDEQYKCVIHFSVKRAEYFQYKWLRDGVELTNSEQYEGLTSCELTLRSLGSCLKGEYSCKLTDGEGQELISEPAIFDPWNVLKKFLSDKGITPDDIDTLYSNGLCTYEALKELPENSISKLSLTLGGEILLPKILEEMKLLCCRKRAPQGDSHETDADQPKRMKLVKTPENPKDKRKLVNAERNESVKKLRQNEEKELTTDDLQEILTRVIDASKDWYNFGLGLGLKVNDLSDIRGDDKTCLRQMIVKYLQSKGPLCWTLLCAVLKMPTVARKDVALEIEKSL